MKHFDLLQERLKPELTRMNEIIRDELHSDNQLLNNVVATYLKTKGKQLRPLLVILSAKMFGRVTEDVLNAGASLEMLHNASLIHDDVVDETRLRRGNPTINARWDNRIAVLVGDFFVSSALNVGIKTGALNVVTALSQLGMELSIGEIEQICNVAHHHLDEESYFSMISKKTASLFRNCVKLGAELAGATEEEAAPLVDYAERLGLCFQIKDDIFDYYDADKIGKPTGNDLREGKVTLPLLYALSKEDAKDGEKMRQLIMKQELNDDDIATLVEFAKREGGVEYAYRTMRDIQAEADKIIAAYPDSEWKDSFREIFDFIISRSH